MLNEVINGLFESLKYVLPALVTVIGMYLLVSGFLNDEREKREIETRYRLKKDKQKDALPLRLQAYERMALFLERIHPNQLLQRVKEPNMTVGEYREALVASIRQEYEYNLSQQIYMSHERWALIAEVKEQMVNLIHQLGGALPQDASALELGKVLLNYTFEIEKGKFPTEVALRYLKEEVREIF